MFSKLTFLKYKKNDSILSFSSCPSVLIKCNEISKKSVPLQNEKDSDPARVQLRQVYHNFLSSIYDWNALHKFWVLRVISLII